MMSSDGALPTIDAIYLNGASSSGKTSLAKALQHHLADYYLHVGIDTFIAMMPEKANGFQSLQASDGFYWRNSTLTNGETVMRIASGVYGKKINQTFHDVVRLFLKQGYKVIIDDVADGNSEVQEWRETLQDYGMVVVGVYCDLAELKRREIVRGNRQLGSAAEQFHRVHQHVVYDYTVDTTALSAEECAIDIIEYISHG